MSEHLNKPITSPRHGFKFDSIPTMCPPPWHLSIRVYQPDEYALMLDCVYEMADQIATGNGWPVEQAIRQVLKDEGWSLLPSHQKMIRDRLADDRLESVFAETGLVLGPQNKE